jgi:NAD(P)-dependent dehydrogenase (short-subunit alcohol dehydrogenase family)
MVDPAVIAGVSSVSSAVVGGAIARRGTELVPQALPKHVLRAPEQDHLLASPASRYVTGQEIRVDGGFTA